MSQDRDRNYGGVRVKHFGDITKIDGHELPIVDIITGGSPCQDLSVAGKRAGLDGERSGLFMEQIRIIKEMREHDRSLSPDNPGREVRPRYMVWENVPGALSSNNGEDFRAVLEETARIADKNAVIPGLAQKQKWTNAGCVMGDGWSIAWRIHDAQFWGVAQRRRRIALVADFGGDTAPEILFERESVPGNIEPCGKERKSVAGGAKDGTGRADSFTLKMRGGAERDSNGRKAGKGALIQTEKSATLGVSQDQTLFALEGNGSRDSHFGNGYSQSNTMYTLNTTKKHAVCYRKTGHPTTPDGAQGYEGTETNDTLHSFSATTLIVDNDALAIGNGQLNQISMAHVSNCLDTMHDKQAIICYGLDRASFNQGQNAQFDFKIEEQKAATIVSRGPGGVLANVSEHCVQETSKE